MRSATLEHWLGSLPCSLRSRFRRFMRGSPPAASNVRQPRHRLVTTPHRSSVPSRDRCRSTTRLTARCVEACSRSGTSSCPRLQRPPRRSRHGLATWTGRSRSRRPRSRAWRRRALLLVARSDAGFDNFHARVPDGAP